MRLVSVRALLGLLLIAVLAVSVVLAAVPESRSAVNRSLAACLEWMQQLGPWGPVAVGAAFIPVCLLFLPGAPLTLFGGFAFGGSLAGLARVIAAVSIGSTLGASLAFLAGRYVARRWIEERVSRNPRFRAIDAAVGEKGFKIVLLSRMSPIFPFNLLNYAFGLTRVSFRDYVLGSWIGMLPGTAMYVYLGSTTRQLTDALTGNLEPSAGQRALFYVGLAATVAVSIVLARAARRALSEAVPETSKRAASA